MSFNVFIDHIIVTKGFAMSEKTCLVRDDFYEEIGPAYQEFQIATLDASLREHGVSDAAVRQRICESFLFAMGNFHDQGWLKPEADSSKLYPLLCFSKLFMDVDDSCEELGEVYAPSASFAFHEYALGTAATYFEEGPNEAVETGFVGEGE